MALLRKDLNKGGVIENFRTIILLNKELKILTKVLSKRVVLVVDKMVGEAHTCAVPTRTIHINLLLIR